MTPLILLLQADSEIQGAFNRYEEFQSGRGEIFMRQLDLAFGFIRKNPGSGPMFAGPYRRFLITGFPYGVFYQVQPTRIVVVSVMDLRQRPQVIRARLGLK